jgi:gamma-glutamyltranspeptidase/glutathione hydrolase
MIRRLCATAALVVAACAPRAPAPELAALPASGAGVPSRGGMVVSASSFASDVGAAILTRGGNAVDAAVATAFALAVTLPSAGNIGGGGFMIVQPADGEPVAIDYRERAPMAATPTMYLDAVGNISRQLTARGYLAPGVPGTVRGLELAHRRFGRLPWRDVVMPAVDLAERGFPMPANLARSLNSELSRNMARFPASVAAYGKRGGDEWSAGDTLRLPDLGKSLRAIAEVGPDVFYTGWIADLIERDMKANGGLITGADLAAYEAKERRPIRGTFRGHEIVSMPPPSSGGTAIVQALNIIEQFDLRTMGRYSAEASHLLIEARRRAFLDRARHLGDPDFIDIPVAKLTSKNYAKDLAAGIDRLTATKSVALGADIVTTFAQDAESEETTHFSVIDRDGMAVGSTYTLEGGYGSHVVVAGAGFLLNNEMGDFNKKPGETNVTGDIGTPANIIAPGKRMLSSMTPTIVTRGGRVVLVTGSPGGRTIINTVLDVVLNVIEFRMNAREAVSAPRMDHQWLPDRVTVERGGIRDTDIERLRSMGHEVRIGGGQGDAHSIVVDLRTGIAYGANDARSGDSKVSVAR